MSMVKRPRLTVEISSNWKQLAKTLKPEPARRKKFKGHIFQERKAHCRTSAIHENGIECQRIKDGAKLTEKNDKFRSRRVSDSLTKCLAIDCEMVGVGTPEMERSILARVSIVNEKNECVYDKYVRPSEEVTNYRTHVSGVTSSHLLHAEEYSTVRREVAALIHKRVLVGHSLKNDFAVLLLSHPKHLIRDTSTYPEFRKLFDGKTPSLKNLTDRLLDVKIQHGIHDSVEDAIAAMTLYKQYAKEWEASQRGCKVRDRRKNKPKASFHV